MEKRAVTGSNLTLNVVVRLGRISNVVMRWSGILNAGVRLGKTLGRRLTVNIRVTKIVNMATPVTMGVVPYLLLVTKTEVWTGTLTIVPYYNFE